jgi:hypothetical protein
MTAADERRLETPLSIFVWVAVKDTRLTLVAGDSTLQNINPRFAINGDLLMDAVAGTAIRNLGRRRAALLWNGTGCTAGIVMTSVNLPR